MQSARSCRSSPVRSPVTNTVSFPQARHSSTASLAPADERILKARADGDEATATALVGADPFLCDSAYGIAKRALTVLAWIVQGCPIRDDPPSVMPANNRSSRPAALRYPVGGLPASAR